MVYTGLPYSSWKGRSETTEEKKERHKIEQKKREQEEQIRKRQIENDLTFAKERYGTTGFCNYIIPEKDLPKDFKTSGVIININLFCVIKCEHEDNNKFKKFYRTSTLIFSKEQSELRGLPNYLANILDIPSLNFIISFFTTSIFLAIISLFNILITLKSKFTNKYNSLNM